MPTWKIFIKILRIEKNFFKRGTSNTTKKIEDTYIRVVSSESERISFLRRGVINIRRGGRRTIFQPETDQPVMFKQ